MLKPVVALLALLLFPSHPRAQAPDALFKPLLPGPRQAVCFTGTFTGRTMDIADWSKPRTEDVPYVAPDGTRGITKSFPREKDVAVTSFVLKLEADDRKASYDRIYNFTLRAETGGPGVLIARGECPWYDKPYVDKDLPGYRIEANTTRFGCGIDCDGGSFALTRVAGTRSIIIGFDDMGLLMKKGCGGGGRFRVHANASGGEFRLEPAPLSRCKGLKSAD
jgi:hypothetical protein